LLLLQSFCLRILIKIRVLKFCVFILYASSFSMTRKENQTTNRNNLLLYFDSINELSVVIMFLSHQNNLTCVCGYISCNSQFEIADYSFGKSLYMYMDTWLSMPQTSTFGIYTFSIIKDTVNNFTHKWVLYDTSSWDFEPIQTLYFINLFDIFSHIEHQILKKSKLVH
jgi:hypothetical protein